MRGIDCALFLDIGSSSSNRRYGSSSSSWAIGPGLVVEALLARRWGSSRSSRSWSRLFPCLDSLSELKEKNIGWEDDMVSGCCLVRNCEAYAANEAAMARASGLVLRCCRRRCRGWLREGASVVINHKRLSQSSDTHFLRGSHHVGADQHPSLEQRAHSKARSPVSLVSVNLGLTLTIRRCLGVVYPPRILASRLLCNPPSGPEGCHPQPVPGFPCITLFSSQRHTTPSQGRQSGVRAFIIRCTTDIVGIRIVMAMAFSILLHVRHCKIQRSTSSERSRSNESL